MEIWKDNERARAYDNVLYAVNRYSLQPSFTNWIRLRGAITQYNKLGGKGYMDRSKLAVYYPFEDTK